MFKKLLLIALITLSSQQTFAASDCSLLGEWSSDIFDAVEAGKFEQLSDKFLQPGVEFTADEQKLVFKALIFIEMEPVTTWADVVTNYEWPTTYNELHLVRFKIKETQTELTYVWSYPGDNEYGVILTDKAEVIAEIGDGEISCL